LDRQEKMKMKSKGHILRSNCPLEHITTGEIEGRRKVTGRRERRSKQLLDNRKRERERERILEI
jgi:hypothetical protein